MIINNEIRLSELDRKILDVLQLDIPLVENPFYELSKILNTSENKIIESINLLINNNIIRQISAVLNSKKLNYKSTLVALKVDKNQLPKTASIINKHPGVSHNYERDNEFNLWFTITVPVNHDLEMHIKNLLKNTEVSDYISLPALKMYKRRVRFRLTDLNLQWNYSIKQIKGNFYNIDKNYYKYILNELHNGLKIESQPYKYICNKFDINLNDLFSFISHFKLQDIIKRISAILKNNNIGFKYNAMVVWNVKEKFIDEIGSNLTDYEQISHCYKRKKNEKWLYNFYTMMHSIDYSEILKMIDLIKKTYNLNEYKILLSTKEYKKQNIEYFSDKFNEYNNIK